MTEEFGGYGAEENAAAVLRSGTHHLAAIESDRGGFAPLGFSTDAGAAALQKLKRFSSQMIYMTVRLTTIGFLGSAMSTTTSCVDAQT